MRRRIFMTGDNAVDEPVSREEEDDYDLLTFGEAGYRLDHEIRRHASMVSELEADPNADPGQLAALRARLEQLREAASRNARQPITDENFKRFFGYEGK